MTAVKLTERERDVYRVLSNQYPTHRFELQPIFVSFGEGAASAAYFSLYAYDRFGAIAGVFGGGNPIRAFQTALLEMSATQHEDGTVHYSPEHVDQILSEDFREMGWSCRSAWYVPGEPWNTYSVELHHPNYSVPVTSVPEREFIDVVEDAEYYARYQMQHGVWN